MNVCVYQWMGLVALFAHNRMVALRISVILIIFVLVLCCLSACSKERIPSSPVSIVTTSPSFSKTQISYSDTATPHLGATVEGLVATPSSVAVPRTATPLPTVMSTTAIPRITVTPVVAPPTPKSDMAPRYGGILSLVSRKNILHQDVHLEVSPALSTWGPGIVYSRLLRFKSGFDVHLPSQVFECELCTRWEMVDTTSYVFNIRKNVWWQDIQPVNGRILTAADILFSYNRQRLPGLANSPLLKSVQDINVTNSYDLHISLAQPDADFLVSLADGHSKVVAREVVETHGDLKIGPSVGTGPWILEKTIPNVSHTFKANPNYFEEGMPLVENLVIHIITDSATRDAAFRVNAIDVTQMDPKEWVEFRQEEPMAPFIMTRDAGTGLEVALKTTLPPFDDIRARKAAFQSMDPWEAIQDLWLGAGFVSLGFPVMESDWLLDEEEIRNYFGHPQQAKELLRDMGSGMKVPISIKVGDFGETYLDHADRISDEMRSVGFDVSLDLVNRKVFGDEVWLGGDYQMFVGPTAPVATTNGYLLSVLHSQGKWNTTEYWDEQLDKRIETQAIELDSSVRKELVREIQRRVLDNSYRYMPATQVSIWTWWPRVQDFYPNFAGFGYSHWSKVWLKD